MDSTNPQTSSPALQSFFAEVSKTFAPIQSAGRTRIPDDFDDACMTDYSFSEAGIYLAFASSVSTGALDATIDAALKTHVGVYSISAANPRPLRGSEELIALKEQRLGDPAPRLKKADIFEMLQEEGWTLTRDPDDGSRSATFASEDRVFRLLPYIRETQAGIRIDWGAKVVPQEYRRAIAIINGKQDVFYPLRTSRGKPREAHFSLREEAKAGLRDILSTLREEYLAGALEEIANLPLSSPGNAPLRLLAAKACRGSYSDLCEIRDKMKAGDRQGFIKFISIAHVERAVEACVELNDALT